LRTSDMIKSKYWRGKDLKGQPAQTLTIADVTEELLGRGKSQEPKAVLWFNETLKGLRLNATSVAVLELAYGPDSDQWNGKRVRLSFDPTVMFGGELVGGVKLQTPAGVVYGAEAPLSVPGRPPAPVWDEQGQRWVTPAPPPATAAPKRPPPPVWNEAAQAWDTVDSGTGEISSARHVPPKTISQRVNEGHPAGAADAGWSSVAPPVKAPAGDADFDDDIPF
jgi:hypothetical protein